MSIEHLFPANVPSDFVLKRSILINDSTYSVIILANYSHYSTEIDDVWGLVLVVDESRPYLAGGYKTLTDAISASRGAFGALLAVKTEHGDDSIVEDDIINFVLTHSGPNNEYETTYYDLRRKQGY